MNQHSIYDPEGMIRRIVEMNIFMLGQPSIPLGFMGIQVVQNQTDFPVRKFSHCLVRKVRKLSHPARLWHAST